MKKTLKQRLIFVILLNVAIIVILIMLILPKLLVNIYEDNIYRYLKQPHSLIRQNVNSEIDDIAYFFIQNDQITNTSSNYNELVEVSPQTIINEMSNSYGKIEINKQTYYYYQTINREGALRITITTDSYLNSMINQTLLITLSVMFFVFFITMVIIYRWTNNLVEKVSTLKSKVDSIEDKDYPHHLPTAIYDEMSILEEAIETMRLRILSNEQEKNELFQNISHDLKTPIAVIRAQGEAIKDKVIDQGDGLKVIDKETEKLMKKVNSLLFINKLDNLKVKYKYISLDKLVEQTIEQYQLINPKLIFKFTTDHSQFLGLKDIWEVIIDNILSNASRYANKEISININNNQLTISNDGPKIEEKLLKQIFNPYVKGSHGNSGLGLWIVKKSLIKLNYKVEINNEKNNVNFKILN